MDHELILTIEQDHIGADPDPKVCEYEKVELYYTNCGNWMYVAYKGPSTRYINLSGIPEGAHCFLVTAGEVLTLLRHCGHDDLIERFFPHVLMNQ